MSKARILADLGNTTADHAELSKLDGVPVGLTFDQLAKFDGLTATTDELNKSATTGKSIAMSIVFG